ncbi:Flp pilus assembly protein TadG [Microbacteriaceae bacterium SG_E_30_P1]|uniref:Flp pilus assembly protein TadG n=1 Tax=Antiquaquibacter oligotrophicus TaxID=2880260 RepID=A0ABT6KQP2_9MICO|nr:pilus assembly protein TadG-related protein [Antiquaquibacter oligotrophicus]MDH6182296.1 Flp pilus assembly protein TadG [Antiquaquibacter oligotrophicus]UDF12048.1 pilus assembly protein TadG-related protein [Antiquaquibacter oligotrophicus]
MRRLISGAKDERGASAVFIAMTMTIVLIVAALVVDMGAAISRDAQLQDAADAAALSLAQRCYESPATTDVDGCAADVRAGASATANAIADATVGDGNASVVGEPVFGDGTVTVNLTSTQNALFSWSVGSSGTDVAASATAQWNTAAVALPLAVNSCVLGEPSEETTFIGTGLYGGVETLLSSVGGLIAIFGGTVDLADYVEKVVNCNTNLLAGGWLANMHDDCTFDPNLATYVGASLRKIVAYDSCADVIRGLEGKRVLVPVYDSAVGTAVGSVFGETDIKRFAEIRVTGWDFEGILSSGENLEYYPPGGEDPGCSSDLGELLGLGPGVVSSLLPFVEGLLAEALACQGLQGQVVDDDLTEQEAAEILTPYRLVA